MNTSLPTSFSSIDISHVQQALRSAGDDALARTHSHVEAVNKGSVSDFATDSDLRAEHALRNFIATHYPDHRICGEELGESGLQEAEITWHIDPIDGTYNYASGSDYWCSALAIQSPDDALGMVYRPATRSLVWGCTATGGFSGSHRLAQLTPVALDHACLVTYLHPPYLHDEHVQASYHSVASQAGCIRMLGSGSLELAGVASGVFDVWMQHSCPEWDWLPGKALIESVGGITHTRQSGGVRWHIAGRPGCTEEILNLLP